MARSRSSSKCARREIRRDRTEIAPEIARERIGGRACQVAILPGHRAKGHGGKLLQAPPMTRAIHPRLNLQNDATCGTQAVYDYANAEGAVEVTVEDPNPQAALVDQFGWDWMLRYLRYPKSNV